MKGYLLGAAGVIFLSVIISLLVPEGKLNKTVMFFMRIICIFVLIQPLTKLFSGFNSSEKEEVDADYVYISGVYSNHQSNQMEELLKSEFSVDSDCDVEVTYENEKFVVRYVSVALDEKDMYLFNEIQAYLEDLGYINISICER